MTGTSTLQTLRIDNGIQNTFTISQSYNAYIMITIYKHYETDKQYCTCSWIVYNILFTFSTAVVGTYSFEAQMRCEWVVTMEFNNLWYIIILS